MRKWIAFTLALCVVVGSMTSLGCHPRHHGRDHGYSQQRHGDQDFDRRRGGQDSDRRRDQRR